MDWFCVVTPLIHHVIFNGPATIVFWKDGTKTVVKRKDGDSDNKHHAIMYATLKKMFGSTSAANKYMDRLIEEAESRA